MTNKLARKIAAHLMAASFVMAAAMAAASAPTAPTSLLLRDATPLHLRLLHGLAFAGSKPGDLVELEIVDDLRIDGVLVMAHGARAIATITQAEPKSRQHRGGLLGLNLDSVQLLNSVKVPIRVAKLATPPLLLSFGPAESFAEGTGIDVVSNGDLKLDPATFLEDISFTSNPPGALASIYGAGRPHTVHYPVSARPLQSRVLSRWLHGPDREDGGRSRISNYGIRRL